MGASVVTGARVVGASVVTGASVVGAGVVTGASVVGAGVVALQDDNASAMVLPQFPAVTSKRTSQTKATPMQAEGFLLTV